MTYAENEVWVTLRWAKRIPQGDVGVGIRIASLFLKLIGLWKIHLDGPLDGNVIRPKMRDKLWLTEFAVAGLCDDYSGVILVTKDHS